MPSIIIDVLDIIILSLFQVLKATWWIIIPVVIFNRIKPLWLFKKRVEYSQTLDWVLLDVILPSEVEKTPKAMENVLEGLHGAWREIKGKAKWMEGKSADVFSLEIVGTNGELHFYIRCLRNLRNFVEGKIYAQYPDAEITEATDYTQELPPDIPNKDYNLWGADMVLTKHWAYPIRTYFEFEDIEEERRLDSMSQFAEMVSKMEDGEHVWMQILISPVSGKSKMGGGQKGIEDEAKDTKDELMGRKKSASKGFGSGVAEFLGNLVSYFFVDEIKWSENESPKEVDVQKLTIGEQKTIEKIEIKASKASFATVMRIIYLARNDIYHPEHIPAIMGFLRQFSGANSFKPNSDTSPKSSMVLFKKQRNYLRKLNLMTTYRQRILGLSTKPYVLSTEELATLYHYPGRIVHAPLMPRIQSRTSEPPKGLPR